MQDKDTREFDLNPTGTPAGNLLKRWFDRQVKYWTTRRHDKLELAVIMVLGAAVPIMLCYGFPSLSIQFEEWQVRMAQEQSQREIQAFQEKYANLITLCDQEVTVSQSQPGLIPNGPILLVDLKRPSSVQHALAQNRQPTSAQDVAVVVCIGNNKFYTTTICDDGTEPDFTPYTGYEEGLEAQIRSTPGAVYGGDTYGHHSDITGRVMRRYQVLVTVYDVASGKAIAQTTISGAEAPLCATTDLADMDVDTILSGKRVTEDDLTRWLEQVLPN